ncbi:DUF4233 domain-containing protein [Naumannella halotolerans]|uniref:Uncharacterized protein DUF4233 n=1 Tax=Naumannella halotolerans TaxID=993414 RepID=A0A4R7J908_9ACTN|nr:DUF4233 domain-containing protein [Naumannella halotolerans]TDT33991.1 uncharacterized protein DUF4233 [Naumannella halotolerans]
MKLQPGNPMQSVLLTVLAFEVIVYGLSIFVLDRIAGLPIALAAALGGGVALLALLAAATLRRGTVGYVLGWLTQIVSIGLGFAQPAIWVMVALFGGLWVLCLILGRRLERNARDAV